MSDLNLQVQTQSVTFSLKLPSIVKNIYSAIPLYILLLYAEPIENIEMCMYSTIKLHIVYNRKIRRVSNA